MENKLIKTSNQLEIINLTASAYLNESAEKMEAFVKNLASFCVLNRVQFSEDGNEAIFRIPDYSGGKKTMVEAKVNKEVFILEMYRATLEGLSVLKKECYPVFRKNNERGDYDLQIQVDYKFEMSKFTELGYRIEFIHVRAGDEFVEVKPFLHTWKIAPRKNAVTKMVGGAVSNDVLFYGVAFFDKENNLIASYFESQINIVSRANPSSRKFYTDANSYHTMHEKFIFRVCGNEIRKRYGLRIPNFDNVENNVQYSNYELVEETEIAEEKQIVAKKPIEKGSELWDTMLNAIISNKVKTIDAIDKVYEIAEEDRPEILELFNQKAEEEK